MMRDDKSIPAIPRVVRSPGASMSLLIRPLACKPKTKVRLPSRSLTNARSEGEQYAKLPSLLSNGNNSRDRELDSTQNETPVKLGELKFVQLHIGRVNGLSLPPARAQTRD